MSSQLSHLSRLLKIFPHHFRTAYALAKSTSPTQFTLVPLTQLTKKKNLSHPAPRQTLSMFRSTENQFYSPHEAYFARYNRCRRWTASLIPDPFGTLTLPTSNLFHFLWSISIYMIIYFSQVLVKICESDRIALT